MKGRLLYVKGKRQFIGKSSTLFLNLILGILNVFSLVDAEANRRSVGSGPFPESSMTRIQGVLYHYRSFEPMDDGEPKGKVLLIHGFGSSTFSWRKCFAALTQKGYEVMAVDIPPFGFSDRDPKIDHSPSANAERLWELLDRVGFQKAWIAGHSMGARVAGSMGALKPGRTEGVFLVDGPFFGTQEKDLGRKCGNFFFNNPLFRQVFEKLGNWMGRKRKIVRKALEYAYGEKPSEEAVEGYMRPFRIKGTAYSVPPYFLEAPAHSLPLEDLKSKLHLIWGEHDRLFSRRMPERLLDTYPYEARISVIQGSGHCPMETHPEAFLDVLFREMKP